jgi:hypothetical protein
VGPFPPCRQPLLGLFACLDFGPWPFFSPILGCFLCIKFGRVSSLKLALNQQEVLVWHIKTAGKSPFYEEKELKEFFK